jgi:hypothetical protein
MKGFYSIKSNVEDACGNTPKTYGYGSSGYTNSSDFLSKIIGYQLDKKNDVYVLNSYGAFHSNVPTIKSIDELSALKSKNLNQIDLHAVEVIERLIKNGYQMVVGPAFPMANGRLDRKSVLSLIKNNTNTAE